MIQTFNPMSNWNLYGQNDNIEAQVIVSTQNNTNLNPVGLSFKCSRFAPKRDKRIDHIFKNAIKGKAHLDMMTNDSCAHEGEVKCGNMRGYLSECRCKVLDRKKDYRIRHEYENRVMTTILDILKPNMSSFHLKLAISCSGSLLGEQILLFRLIDKLNQKHAKGTIELFFIDKCYRQAVINSRHDGDFSDSVGRENYMNQFLTEICQCLPKDISVKGTFFYDSNDYIHLAKSNPNFRHHLLIGSDIEQANFEMGKVGKEAGLGMTQPIVLIRTETTPGLCQLDPVGKAVNCYNPIDNLAVRKENRNLPLLIIGVGIIVIGLVASSVLLRLALKNLKKEGKISSLT